MEGFFIHVLVHKCGRLPALDSNQLLISWECVAFSEIEAYHMQPVISSRLGNRLSTVPDKPVKRNVV